MPWPIGLVVKNGSKAFAMTSGGMPVPASGALDVGALKGDPDTADIPVIVWSMITDRQRGFAMGVTEFLTKPSERDRLIEVISKYVRPAETGV